MKDRDKLGPWVRRFLLEHMVADRNLSKNTQRSYRNTLALLLPFVAKGMRKPVDQLLVEHLAADSVRTFLQHLEDERHCCIATRNQRLAAVHAFASFVGEHVPEYIAWCGEIRSIPFKKTAKPHICYLEKSEIDAVLNAARGETPQSQRDHALLLFLYNSGARASEAVQLTIGHLELRSVAGTEQHLVKLFGKGSKTRYCPLWSATANAIRRITQCRKQDEPVFLNRLDEPLTRSGVFDLVRRYSKKAVTQAPSLADKKVGPHVLRHTTACHLLKAGVDINTIRAWLGHVSLDTTNVYAEIDVEMKSKALAKCEILGGRAKPCRDDRDLMAFLKSL